MKMNIFNGRVSRLLHWHWHGLVVAVVFAVVSFLGEDAYQQGDMWGTLLSSQSLIEHGTLSLENYSPEVLERYDWQIIDLDGSMQTAYPPGNALFSLPFVAAANFLGLDMREAADERLLQGILASLTAAGATFLIYLIGSIYLSRSYSLLVAILMGFGTTLISNCGVALFNFNYTNVAILLILYLLVRWREPSKLVLVFISVLFWCAYITRPSAAPFIAIMMAYLIIRTPRRILYFAAPALCLFILTVVYGYIKYDYYYPSIYRSVGLRWDFFGEALYGHTFSPSRGLFIYSPFLIIVFIVILWRIRTFLSVSLNVAVGLWFLLHFSLLCTWECWWGGGGFGYRILSDALPALGWFSIWAMKLAVESFSYRARIFYIGSQLLLGVISIYVHSYQGLYNVWTAKFHWDPQASSNLPDIFLDWRFPQIGFSEEDYARRHHVYREEFPYVFPAVPSYSQVLMSLDFTKSGENYRWGDGWGAQEEWGRWAVSNMAELFISMENIDIDLAIFVEAEFFNNDRDVAIFINNHFAGRVDQWGKHALLLKREYLLIGENRLSFIDFEMASPLELGASNDGRRLGIGLRRGTIFKLGAYENIPH